MEGVVTLLEVEGLGVSIVTDGERHLSVVSDVSISLSAGTTVALVGESGSGKTLTLRAILGLLPLGTAITAGQIRYLGDDVCQMTPQRRAALRGSRVGMVFQDSSTALDPLMRIGAQVEEVARKHLGVSRKRAATISVEWLERVGIPSPERRARAYPHELSGGQRQRVAIAMALVAEPELLLCDEPTTALDVTVQAQILRLLSELTSRVGAGVLFVTHDLPVASQVAQYVNVMYAGRIVEAGPAAEVFAHPKHPYTRGLLKAVPTLHGDLRQPEGIPGALPEVGASISGCCFYPRCSVAADSCRQGEFPLLNVGYSRATACALHETLPAFETARI
jgi:oligopeptide/dipeptide ABC transporter ATP-binding protein